MPDSSSPLEVPDHRKQSGLFITRGARIVIPAGGLRINLADGEIDAPITVHVGLDVIPIWATIALDHILAARGHRNEVIVAWQGTDDDVLGNRLIGEFSASMQAITAAGIAVDALYAAVKPTVNLPAEVIASWRSKRTARYKQVTEVLRRAFRISARNAVRLREVLRTVYRFRDWAVHPPTDARAPAFHPDLQMGTEWRFVTFSYPNAREITRACLSLIWQAANKPDVDNPDLRRHCEGLRGNLAPVIEQWERDFGPITPVKNAAPDPTA
jgi:hypothetical protein